MKSPILVVGSSNTDMVVRTPQLPMPGQTVLGGDFFMHAGGKGANQAVAAARLNGAVTFISRIGDDLFGRQAVENLKKEGIDCRYIKTDSAHPSGVALITVDAEGENCIVVASGANAYVSKKDILSARELLSETDIYLVQLEIPLDTVQALVELASALGKTIILNPAPACALPDALLQKVTVLTPNEKEAEMLTGIPVTDDPSAARAAEALARKGVLTVIITLGRRGCLLWAEGRAVMVPAPEVTALDTTGAGDVFNGALAVALAEGRNLPDAVAFANMAAALSVTKLGAQTSAPSRGELQAFAANLPERP